MGQELWSVSPDFIILRVARTLTSGASLQGLCNHEGLIFKREGLREIISFTFLSKDLWFPNGEVDLIFFQGLAADCFGFIF